MLSLSDIKRKALDKKTGKSSHDSSLKNPASYASHTKRLGDAYSSHREYLASNHKKPYK